MTRERHGALAFVLLAAVLAAVVALTLSSRQSRLSQRPAAERPVLLLLTSLPLVFGERFSLQGGGSPALKALQSRYRVVPISVADPLELKRGRLLLMAHPLAQPAEDLVALDAWVRSGGRLLLLADPMLEWPSERPLGDPLRPPPMFMDTGLLAHWGLRLDAPDERGRRTGKLGGLQIVTESPGTIHGGCRIAADRLVARCRIGEGEAIVVADADFLDTERLKARRNLDALLAELDSLEPR